MIGDAGCRGYVTVDVLAKGLSRGAIATSLLEGVKADTKTRGFYTSSAPSMKVKPTSSCDGINMISMAREQTSFA